MFAEDLDQTLAGEDVLPGEEVVEDRAQLIHVAGGRHRLGRLERFRRQAVGLQRLLLVLAEGLLGLLQVTPRIRGDFLARSVDLHLARGESISDAQIAELLTAAPLDSYARRVIVRALAQRGERSAAFAHLQFLPHLGVPRREAMELAQQLELNPSGAGDGS